MGEGKSENLSGLDSMHYAYIDESVSGMSNDRYFMVVASVITPDPRALTLEIRRMRKRLNIKIRSDVHASSTPPEAVKGLLQALRSDTFISVIAVAWEGHRKEIDDREHLYKLLVARCAELIVREHRRVDLYIDKKYTNKHSLNELERSIREAIAKYSENIVRIFQVDSQAVKELVSADFVAWAFMQHYCRGKHEFYNIIRHKVRAFDNKSQQKKSGSPRAPITTALGGVGLPTGSQLPGTYESQPNYITQSSILSRHIF